MTHLLEQGNIWKQIETFHTRKRYTQQLSLRCKYKSNGRCFFFTLQIKYMSLWV